jgi:hypothetical protein
MFEIYLRQLNKFKDQGDSVNLDEFEKWKNSLLEKLPGSYRARFASLEFFRKKLNTEETPF